MAIKKIAYPTMSCQKAIYHAKNILINSSLLFGTSNSGIISRDRLNNKFTDIPLNRIITRVSMGYWKWAIENEVSTSVLYHNPILHQLKETKIWAWAVGHSFNTRGHSTHEWSLAVWQPRYRFIYAIFKQVKMVNRCVYIIQFKKKSFCCCYIWESIAIGWFNGVIKLYEYVFVSFFDMN